MNNIYAAFFSLVAGIFLSSPSLLADGFTEKVSGPIEFEVVRVYDGDTFTVIVHPWPRIQIETGVRVAGADTPELHNSGCEKAARLSQEALKFTTQALTKARVKTLTQIEEDKYGGRIVAVVNLDGKNLADLLISSGYAFPYSGGTKTPWCP